MSTSNFTIAQVCYVTHDIERAIAQWSNGLGAGPFYVMECPADFGERSYRGSPATDGYKAALGFSCSTLIEFIQPTDDEPSVFQEVLKTKGDMAVHHVYHDVRQLSSTEYDSRRDRYLKLGYAAALDMVLPGLGRVALFDAREQLGVFVELMEGSPPVYTSLDKIYAAHVNWNGQRPLREFMESMSQ